MARTRFGTIVLLLIACTFAVSCGDDNSADKSDGGSTDTTTTTSADTGGTGGGSSLEIADLAFSPDTLSVAAGTTIEVTNSDSTNHTVTSGADREPDGKFDLALDGGSSDSFTIDEAGTYPFFCQIHSSMKGTIEVTG